MPIKIDGSDSGPQSDLDIAIQLQNILLLAVEGARHAELDNEYRAHRMALLADPTYANVVPSFVRRHADLGSLWSALKSFDDQWEPRRREVRRQFEPLLREAEAVQLFGTVSIGDTASAEIVRHPRYDSSAWTGASSPKERLAAVRTLVPVARAAVETLIVHLEAPRHNGGPPLDETEEALSALKALHKALGDVLVAAEAGKLTEAYAGGLPIEAAKFARRVARTLKDDPLPYALAATIMGTLTACGFPTLGGFLTDVALQMTKKKG